MNVRVFIIVSCCTNSLISTSISYTSFHTKPEKKPNYAILQLNTQFRNRIRKFATECVISQQNLFLFPFFHHLCNNVEMLQQGGTKIKLFHLIQKKYDFTDFQIAQLQYTFKTVLSELSKIIILAFLFHNQIWNFLMLSLLLCFLRICSGGLHCKTYLGCFLTSVGFYIITLKYTAALSIPHKIKRLMLLLCILIGYCISPVTSKYHKKLEPRVIRLCRTCYLIILLLFLSAMYIFPYNSYLHIGFWVIVLHTLQLGAAKIVQKGASNA